MVSGSGKGHNAECQHRNLKNGFGNLYIIFSFIFIYFLDFHVVFFLPKLYTLNRSGMCDIQVRQSRLQRGVSKLRVLTIQETKIWDSFLFYFDSVGIFFEWKQFKFHCFVAFHVRDVFVDLGHCFVGQSTGNWTYLSISVGSICWSLIFFSYSLYDWSKPTFFAR